MQILISNDDGIFSPGLLALAKVAQNFGHVRIVAPDVEQSAMGHAITIMRPLHYHATKLLDFEAYRVNGTPADCVALGAYHWDKVDLVLSGINLGLNIGSGIGHSGTVAAAKQAALLDIPAIAFSAPTNNGAVDYAILEPFIKNVIETFLTRPDIRLLNANLPLNPHGICWTRVSVRHYEGHVVPSEDPMGRKHYWFAAKPLTQAEPGTDRYAIEQNFVSLTPLRLDMTDDAALHSIPYERSAELVH
jgi:5'-nucleotidase